MADFELPSSESLRRNALSRSAQRNAEVARRRLRWRWAAWVVQQLLRWVVLPALLVAAAVSALHEEKPAGTRVLRPSAPPAHEPGVQLRLDEEQPAYAHRPRRAPQAQSGASPIVDDRSSRER